MSFGFSDKQSDAFIGQCMALMSICLFPCENVLPSSTECSIVLTIGFTIVAVKWK
jgi:hypothetical protein